MYTDLVAFYTYLVDSGKVSISTIDTLHNVVHPALQMAVNDNMIRRNVSDYMKKSVRISELVFSVPLKINDFKGLRKAKNSSLL